MKDTTTKDTTMRLKNTPTLTKGIVTNHMTTKDMTILTMATIMTKMVIIQKTTLMKVITMQKKHTITMLMLTKVTTTTTDTLMV